MVSWLDPRDWQEHPTDVDAEAKLYDRMEDDRLAELDERDRLEDVAPIREKAV